MQWLLVTLILGLSYASYVERVNISVAAELMMPDLSINKSDMSLVFNSFLVGYAIFQVPAGWLGDRFGPRLVLGVSSFAWGILTLLSGLLPGSLLGTSFGAIAVLLSIRFLLGAFESSTYPVSAEAVHRWVAPARRATGNSGMVLGSSMASALTAPFVSWSMVRYGWRSSFYLSSIAAFVISALWMYLAGKLHAVSHEKVIEAVSVRPARSSFDANVLLLSLSYVSEGYLLFMFVSWLYIYLVEVRGFSLARGGLVTGIPWIAAMIAAPLGGFLSDRLSVTVGRVQSARFIIMTGYTLSGILLFVAARAESRLSAVLALCISLASLYLAESSFWTMATTLADHNSGAISGFMNTMGILGGIASNALVAVFVKHYGQRGWLLAFASGTAMGLFCAVIWWVLGRRLRHASVNAGAR